MLLAGLAVFTYFGDPAGGNDNAPGAEWAIAIAVPIEADNAKAISQLFRMRYLRRPEYSSI